MSDISGGMRVAPPGTTAQIGGDFEPTPPPAPVPAAVPAPVPVRPVTRWVELPLRAGQTVADQVEIYDTVPFAYLVDLVTAQAEAQKAQARGKGDQARAVSAMAGMIEGALVDPDAFDAFLKDRRNAIDAKAYGEIVMALAGAIASGQAADGSGKA